MALLDLVPPALALVLDHGGLFDEDAGGGAEEVEEVLRLAPATGAKNSQPGKMVASPVRVATWVRSSVGSSPPSRAAPASSAAGQAGVDGGEEFFGDGGFGEREEEGVVERGAGALGVGVEAADGFDLVAEEVDADGAVRSLESRHR